jgi:hypothetical protein
MQLPRAGAVERRFRFGYLVGILITVSITKICGNKIFGKGMYVSRRRAQIGQRSRFRRSR